MMSCLAFLRNNGIVKMTEQLVREWLSDYAGLSPVEAHTFVASLEHNQELVAAIYTVLEGRDHYQKLVDPVCNQLFAFYRSKEPELQKFTIQFIPTLVYVYLNSVSCREKKNDWSVETLLLGIYNLEVVDESGQPKVVSFRLPSLAQSSIYHETMHLDPASLTQKELRRLEECNTRLISWGPLPQVESLNAQNRLKTMTTLLFVYNRHLSRFHKSALEKLCRVCSKIAAQGFTRVSSHPHSNSSASLSPQRPPPRIPVSSQFLLELLHAIYFAMFNELSSMAVQALEDVHFRGCYECLPDIMLVAGAIRNSIKDTPSGQALDGPMGISMAVSPATNTVTVSKSMITNASFRTKKLPDDIPIQQPADGTSADVKDPKNLMSISEEKEDDAVGGSSVPERLTPRGSSLRAASGMSLPKLPNLQALVGKRGRKEGSQERKVTPPHQNKTSSKLPAVNGDSFELDSLRKKGNSENGVLTMDDGADSIDSVDKASADSIENLHNNGGPASDSGSFMTVDSGDTVDGDNLTTNSSATPLLGRKSNAVEIENRGSLQVSTV
ncbi:hypothetical protein FOCC_FOCC008101 [Frankliniella occidentalis]|nr:hypothetical protein FOCC_FOCC008101 [Frankliniella occidentalis]